MKWELWQNAEKTQSAFFPVDDNYQKKLELLEMENSIFELIWSVEADTYNEAMQKYYDFMDWGRYQPF